MRKITVAVLGCGNRGQCYAELIMKQPEKFSISAICDPDPKQLEKMKTLFSVKAEEFLSVEAFFEKNRADLLIISTPDREHIPQAVRAMELGYDILLEKPISDSREEIDLLLKTQKKTGKKVMVCHVLRFGPGYRKCKEILDSGILGKLYAIDASERVVYWHWAQAYVRCIGALAETGHPTILAKCSHDLDLLQYYANSRCETLSSLGDTGFFKKENAPEGAAERCLDCKYVDTCSYSAKKIYIDNWHKKGKPEYLWPFYRACKETPITEKGLYEGLKTADVGRCVFACRVDHADHQLIQMEFENKVRASLKMVFAGKSGRRIVFYGTMGEMIFDEREDSITVMPFGAEAEVIKIGAMLEGGHAHGGGDAGIVNELYEMLSGRIEAVTSLEKSVECHLMGIAAEESRKQAGKTVKVHI